MDHGTLVMLLLYVLFFPSVLSYLCVSVIVYSQKKSVRYFILLGKQVIYFSSQNCTKWYKLDFELYFLVNYFLMSILKSCLYCSLYPEQPLSSSEPCSFPTGQHPQLSSFTAFCVQFLTLSFCLACSLEETMYVFL